MADLFDELFGELKGFEWDSGNSTKNWTRHQVDQAEAEQAILNGPLLLDITQRPAVDEPRFIALGETDAARLLAVVFTRRGSLIRVISARPMSKAERRAYGEIAEPYPDI